MSESSVAANLVQPGWLLRVVSEDLVPVEEWLEIFLVLHTKRSDLPDRVWIYLSDRAKPVIFEWDDVVSVETDVIR